MLFNDTLKSFTSGLGVDQFDKASSLQYSTRYFTDLELLAIYKSSWMAKKIVNIPALDAFRKGREWRGDSEAAKLIAAEEKRLGLMRALYSCRIRARLFGGAVIVIGTPANDLSEPIDVGKIKKGDLRYLTVMSRREIHVTELDLDPQNGRYMKPKMFGITSPRIGIFQIHPSRVIYQVGSEHVDPLSEGGSNFGWGDSVIESVYDAVTHSEGSNANIASLIFEANVDTFGIPDMMDQIGDETYRDNLQQRLALANRAKSITKSIMHDKDEVYSRHSASFAGLPDTMEQFLLIVSGAADIPMTRFLGQTPSGLSSSGEGDLNNYYDAVAARRELEVVPEMSLFDEILVRSATGDYGEDIVPEWRPLRELDEVQRADVGEKIFRSAETAMRSGLFDDEELRPHVATALSSAKVFPGFSVEDREDDRPDYTPGAVVNGPASEEIQKLALNGAQITALQGLVEGVAAGAIPIETAGATIRAAFPDLSEEQVSKIVNPLQSFRAAIPITDAEPRTLYIKRNVLNGKEIVAWAKKAGFKTTLKASDLHVTLAYSEAPVDWFEVGAAWEDEIIVKGGPRMLQRFDGGAVVIEFAYRSLNWRHEQIVEAGASWKWDEYRPHITISFNAGDVDVENLPAYEGDIKLGPEIFRQIDPNWKANVVEDTATL